MIYFGMLTTPSVGREVVLTQTRMRNSSGIGSVYRSNSHKKSDIPIPNRDRA